MRNLVIHSADNTMENGIKAFFQRSDWHDVMDCARFDIDPTNDNDFYRVPSHKDYMVWQNAAKNLGSHIGRFEHAVIILDEHFKPSPGAGQIYADIERDMVTAGWPRERFEVIVIRPMMEAWLWTDDKSLQAAFGMGNFPTFRQQLVEEGLWTFGEWKPNRDGMKEVTARAMAAGWRLTKDILFTTVFSELQKEAVDHCIEPGFVLLRQTLQRWFPKEPPIAEGGAA